MAPLYPFALPWLFPFATLLPLLRRTPRLIDEPEISGTLLSIIVPARNESGNIDRVLASLEATAYAPVEILVVDDRSTDDTAARVAAHAARDARVRLIPGEPLPEGWYGKPWACCQGAKAARGGVLVFTDADTTHDPRLLLHAMGALERTDADLLTVVTDQELVSFWERAVMPHLLVPLAVRYRPASLNRATNPRDVVANGQFIMVRRGPYETAGTHEAVRGTVAEDLALAQRFITSGLRLRAWWAEELISTRMYTGLGALVEGWSKNLYLGGRASFPDQPVLGALAPLVLMLAELFWLVPFGGLAAGAAWALPAIGFSVAFWFVVALALRIPPAYALAYPLGSLAVIFIMVRSTLRGRSRVEWRGRTYSGVEERRRGSKGTKGVEEPPRRRRGDAAG